MGSWAQTCHQGSNTRVAPLASPKVTGLLGKTTRVADHEEALGCVCRAGLVTRLKEQRLALWSIIAPGKGPRAWLTGSPLPSE